MRNTLQLPEMILIRQNQPCSDPIENVSEAFTESLTRVSVERGTFQGKSVGIAVGSRGISHIAEVVRETATFVKECGGFPFIFAAMGSHGAGTAEGQREVLEALGITEEYIGAPVETCADDILYGYTVSGLPVYGNSLPFKHDAIILINRVKMHTDFVDITESGIFKLMAVGIGNPTGCKNVHLNALKYGYGKVIRECADVIMNRLPVSLGIMLTENWKHQLDRLKIVLPGDFLERESALLQQVKDQSLRIPVDQADILIVGEIGKNISGAGMDTKVIGRLGIIGQAEPEKPHFSRIVVLDLTEESHGNACGIGLADLAPADLLPRIDIKATTLNSCSAKTPEAGRIPCLMENEYEVMAAAVETCGVTDPSEARIVYIQNTNLLGTMAVSKNLYDEALRDKDSISIVSKPFRLTFDEDGRLINRWKEGVLS